MSAQVMQQLLDAKAFGSECPDVLMSVPEILDPASAHPGQACHPVVVMRWRNGHVVWQGLPEELRLMHRRYPHPVERARACSESGQ